MKRVRRRAHAHFIAGVICACMAIGVPMVATLVYLPPYRVTQWLKKLTREEAKEISPIELSHLIYEERQSLMPVLGWVGIIAGLVVTVWHQRGENAVRTAERERDDERELDARFERAIGHLKSSDVAIRAVGIVALGRLMDDSPRFHRMIVKLMVLYVCEHAAAPSGQLRLPTWPLTTTNSCPVDVQEAMTVLGQRPHRPEGAALDFSGCDLTGVNLSGGNFAGAIFRGADLRGARFGDDDVHGADLRDARLSDADRRTERRTERQAAALRDSHGCESATDRIGEVMRHQERASPAGDQRGAEGKPGDQTIIERDDGFRTSGPAEAAAAACHSRDSAGLNDRDDEVATAKAKETLSRQGVAHGEGRNGDAAAPDVDGCRRTKPVG
jgi:hypothetical protein